MLPIFANLAFNTAPTVFPISVSVSDPQLIKTVRSELYQAELEPGTEESIFRSSNATSMNRPTNNSTVNPASSTGRRRSRTTTTTTNTSVSHTNEDRQQAPSPSDFLTGLVDRMFCCSYSGSVHSYGVDSNDDDSDVVVVNRAHNKVSTRSVPPASLLDGTPLFEKAMDNFPMIERARQVRSSTPTTSSFSWYDSKDFAGSVSIDADIPVTPPPKANKFFVLDDKPDDLKKRLNFYKQDETGGAMTRTSTATTASMERSASSASSSASSLHNWNTLPTQPSEDESSCLSEGTGCRKNNARRSGGGKGGRRHRRRLTDPQLAEQLLMEQLREKLMDHNSRPAAAMAPRSVYHQQLPVE